MRSLSALVLVVFFGAFICCSYALKCYQCQSDDGKYCDNLDKDHADVKEMTCSGTNNVCVLARGTATSKNTF